jgi:hypothetical protein
VEKEYDLPIADKSFNSLFVFNDLKIVLDFLVGNQKKQAFVMQQLLNA